MSVHKENGEREVLVGLDDWENLADRKIREAQITGHFDGLPGFGTPLHLSGNPLEGEWALAHRVLRNANARPRWIDLQQQVQSCSDSLRERLARVTQRLQDQRQWSMSVGQRCSISSNDLELDMAAARAFYLREAAALNRLLLSFNQALPRDLFWLQKSLLTPGRAAANFEKSCGPLASKGQYRQHSQNV